MSGQLPIWEIPLSENSRTRTTERHGDLTITSTELHRSTQPDSPTVERWHLTCWPSTVNTQPSPFHCRHLTIGHPLLTLDHWPSTIDTQPSAVHCRHLTIGCPLSTLNTPTASHGLWYVLLLSFFLFLANSPTHWPSCRAPGSRTNLNHLPPISSSWRSPAWACRCPSRPWHPSTLPPPSFPIIHLNIGSGCPHPCCHTTQWACCLLFSLFTEWAPLAHLLSFSVPCHPILFSALTVSPPPFLSFLVAPQVLWLKTCRCSGLISQHLKHSLPWKLPLWCHVTAPPHYASQIWTFPSLFQAQYVLYYLLNPF